LDGDEDEEEDAVALFFLGVDLVFPADFKVRCDEIDCFLAPVAFLLLAEPDALALFLPAADPAVLFLFLGVAAATPLPPPLAPAREVLAFLGEGSADGDETEEAARLRLFLFSSRARASACARRASLRPVVDVAWMALVAAAAACLVVLGTTDAGLTAAPSSALFVLRPADVLSWDEEARALRKSGTPVPLPAGFSGWWCCCCVSSSSLISVEASSLACSTGASSSALMSVSSLSA
jgi:hypothetical protein